jgi:hypothetical protein
MPHMGESMLYGLIVTLLLGGCGPNFAKVQEADSIEAYEGYLAADPDGRWATEARYRLELLYWEAAQAENNLEAYDRFLEEHPKSRYKKEARSAREKYLFAWAKEVGTPEAWEKYVGEYKNAKDHSKYADNALRIIAYGDGLQLSEPTVKRVNLAEDPKGPLNGWGIYVDVTNNGDKTLATVKLTVDYLDDEGTRLGSKEYALVHHFWRMPVEDIAKIPMKPGETRTWEWTTNKTPERWTSEKVRVKTTALVFTN